MANVPNERAEQHRDASSNGAATIVCPTCQHTAASMFRFCPDCGTRLPFFREHQTIEENFEVVRLVDHTPYTDVYEVRAVEGASPRPSSSAGEIVCAKCSHRAPSTFRFCPECGSRLPFFRADQIIEGKYQVVRLVSQGADSDVYEFRPVETGAGRPAADAPAKEPASIPVVTAPVAPLPVIDPSPATPAAPPVHHQVIETDAPRASGTTAGLSSQRGYDPLARKRFGLGTFIALGVLAALVILAIWIMMRPAPDNLDGNLEVTSTASQVPAPIEEGTTQTGPPVASLPPNVIDPGTLTPVDGEGSILTEIPPVETAPTPVPQTVQTPAVPTPAVQNPAVPTPPAPTPEPQEPASADRRISERQAVNILLTGVNRTDYYGLDYRCIQASSVRFVNEGYTIELVTRNCPGSSRPAGSLLGRWRVDAKNGEAFVQNSEGKYVSP